jgi:hypothetical protein
MNVNYVIKQSTNNSMYKYSSLDHHFNCEQLMNTARKIRDIQAKGDLLD